MSGGSGHRKEMRCTRRRKTGDFWNEGGGRRALGGKRGRFRRDRFRSRHPRSVTGREDRPGTSQRMWAGIGFKEDVEDFTLGNEEKHHGDVDTELRMEVRVEHTDLGGGDSVDREMS